MQQTETTDLNRQQPSTTKMPFSFFSGGESRANRMYKARKINRLRRGLGISKQSSSTLRLQPVVSVS